MDNTQKIEAILFYKCEPQSVADLARVLHIKEAETLEALNTLRNDLSSRGIVLLEANGKYTLGTNVELSGVIEQMRKEELNKDLSKAALETLSIILYKNGAHRAYIDYIRGVNSNFILRVLSARGLVERVEDKDDKRRFVYRPTFDLLAYMGVTRVEELPNYQETLAKLDESYQAVEELTKKESIAEEEAK